MNRHVLRLMSVALVLLVFRSSRPGSTAAPVRLIDDAASPYRWCDAADAFDAASEAGKAAYAYRRALELGSHEGPVLLRAANFQLTRANPASALPYFARLLQLVPDYDASIFGTYSAMRFPVADILQQGVPADRRAGVAYFDYLLSQGAPSADLALGWRWLGRHGFRQERLAGLYTAALLRDGRYDEALKMWTDFAGPYARGNRVYNGSFEKAPLASPLDWTIASELVQRDTANAQTGKFALKIQFSGTENIDFHDVWQSLVVEPGLYHLEAFVKTSGITTAEGLRLHLFDAQQPGRLDFWTESFTGNRPWTRLDCPIRVYRQTHLLTLQLCRRASPRADNKVAGTVWVDAISLVRQP